MSSYARFQKQGMESVFIKSIFLLQKMRERASCWSASSAQKLSGSGRGMKCPDILTVSVFLFIFLIFF